MKTDNSSDSNPRRTQFDKYAIKKWEKKNSEKYILLYNKIKLFFISILDLCNLQLDC